MKILVWGLLLAFASSPILSASPWQGFTALALSPDGRWFATGGREGEVLWFETTTGELRARWLLAGAKPVVALVFDPEGTHLGAAGLDGTRVWLEPSQPPGEVPAGTEVASQLAGAPERWLASPPPAAGVRLSTDGFWARGGVDGRIFVGTGPGDTPTATWQAHDSAVTGLVLTPDGLTLLSAGYDGTLCRWDALTGRPLGRL